MTSLSLVMAVLAVTSAAAAESSRLHDDDDNEPMMPADAASSCYVVTIFGLKTADCGKQSARAVPTSLDSDLQVLRFEDNRLTVLGDGAFSSYANLQEIYLARNRLELVEATALRGLYSLQIIDLEGNQLTTVPAKSLRAVATSLRLLSLKNNPIRRLDADSLSSLTRLEEVNLEDCWLEYIDPLAFSGLERLSALNLVNNELRGVDSSMQSTLPSSLRVVRLYRNPWTCDCRLRWLRRWLVSDDVRRADTEVDATINWDFASNTPTCSAPALIRGVAWRHLTGDQFACPSRIVSVSAAGAARNSSTPTTTGLRATAASNATVECVAAGDPEPIVSWSRGERGGSSGSEMLGPPKALVSVRQGRVGADGEPRIVSVLTLVDVVESTDSGDYSCMAENTAGRAEMTFTLSVHTAPAHSATSGRDPWPVDRDVFLGVLIGLLAIACVIVVCTVLRLCSIARRRRRMHNKNIYYLANTGNHVGPSPTSNHVAVPQTDVETAVTHTALDDDDSKYSDEHTTSPAHVADGKLMSGSVRHHLIPNHDQHRAEQHARHGRKAYSDAAPGHPSSLHNELRHNEDRRLLSADRGADLGETNMDDDVQADDDDNASVSENLSDAASDDDAEALRTNGNGATNLRERPSRAVSFGPNMIIDARRSVSSSGGERAVSPASGGDEVRPRDDVDPVDSDEAETSERTDNNEPVFQRSPTDFSPSLVHRPLPPSLTAGRQTPTRSPAVEVPRIKQSGVDSGVLGIGVGRRHSGDLRPVGNGSVRRPLPTGFQLGRPLSPQTPTPTSLFPANHRPSSESGSLERATKTRRRLPVLSGAVVRRAPSPAVLSGISRGRRSPRGAAVFSGNHVGDWRTPMSLAELLAPPFGDGRARNTPQRPNPVANCSLYDDDSGTDI